MLVWSDMERLNNLHHRYTYAVKTPSAGEAYVIFTPDAFNKTVCG